LSWLSSARRRRSEPSRSPSEHADRDLAPAEARRPDCGQLTEATLARVTKLGDGDGVDRPVQLPVAALVEPVPFPLTRGRLDRWGAVVARLHLRGWLDPVDESTWMGDTV
jgi:hypothetical protein